MSGYTTPDCTAAAKGGPGLGTNYHSLEGPKCPYLHISCIYIYTYTYIYIHSVVYTIYYVLYSVILFTTYIVFYIQLYKHYILCIIYITTCIIHIYPSLSSDVSYDAILYRVSYMSVE